MKIASWNVNSVKVRLPHLLDYLTSSQPDVLCLQEIKCRNEEFPKAAFKKAGYEHIHIVGQKSWHGVAIVWPVPWQRGHVRLIWKNELPPLICPVPWQSGHVTGFVPGAAPDPLQSLHVSGRLMRNVFFVPPATSASFTRTRVSRSFPGSAYPRERMRGPPPAPPNIELNKSDRSAAPSPKSKPSKLPVWRRSAVVVSMNFTSPPGALISTIERLSTFPVMWTVPLKEPA